MLLLKGKNNSGFLCYFYVGFKANLSPIHTRPEISQKTGFWVQNTNTGTNMEVKNHIGGAW